MYIVNDIAYAGGPTPVLRVCGVRPLDDFHLRARFHNSETKIFDFNL